MLFLFVFFTYLNLLICHINSEETINGGFSCAGCTFGLGLAQQLGELNNKTVVDGLQKICHILPSGAVKIACKTIFTLYGPLLIRFIDKKYTPDLICHSIGFCYTESRRSMCHLYPLPKIDRNELNTMIQNGKKMTKLYLSKKNLLKLDSIKNYKFNFCYLPGINVLCKIIDVISYQNKPFFDSDNDGFSDRLTLRGSQWRGKDCDDTDSNIHPGLKAKDSDKFVDSNCNGIYGVNEKGESYEELFCSNLTHRGIILYGDSVGADFHIPVQWINVTQMSLNNFQYFNKVIENEFDWPMMSGATGYQNITWPIRGGPVLSLYQILRQRNRCIHRDYQNLAVNGNGLVDLKKFQLKSLSRNREDNPALVIFEFVGNDVCNRNEDTLNHMTTEKQMFDSALEAIDYLNSTLPFNSKLLMIGLANGSVLFEAMKNRIHPTGSLHRDVTYPQFYDFLGCLLATPCLGYMTSNATLRSLTAKRAAQLTHVLEKVASKYKNHFKNLELGFVKNPIEQVLGEWESKHGKGSSWQLIEPVDGFHPNQQAQHNSAAILIENVKRNFLHFMGDINPHNKDIHDVFGDQGGY